MATVRDPAFWRRFSVAVHLDEEASSPTPAKTLSNTASYPELNHTYVPPSSSLVWSPNAWGQQRILARAATSQETEESLHTGHVAASVYDFRCDRCRRFGLAEPSWMVYAWGEAVVVGEGGYTRLAES